MNDGPRVRVLVVPVFKRHWLLHAWSEPSTAASEGTRSAVSTDSELTGAASSSEASGWDFTRHVRQRAQTISQQLGDKFKASFKSQWNALETSKEGSFQRYLYRMAQAVLSGEDPMESFLKGVPKGASQLEVIYPASMDEAVVRRRLRLMAVDRRTRHKRRILGWSLATLPQVPLMVTPFSNVTVYYSVYRLVSHIQTLSGANMLGSMLKSSAVQSRSSTSSPEMSDLFRAAQQEAAARLRREEQGEKQSRAPPGDRPRSLRRWLRQQFKRRKEPSQQAISDCLRAMPVVFVRSQMLEDVVQPLERWGTPLPDKAALALLDRQCFDLSGFMERLGRVRGRALEAERRHMQKPAEAQGVGASC